MHVLITGANGFVGRALGARLLADGTLQGRRIERLSALDLDFGDAPSAQGVLRRHAGDLADPAWLTSVLAAWPVDVVFHLASIPGGSAEANYALARRVNLNATIDLLERGQAQAAAGGPAPVFVFASTIAVFGAMPPLVTDDALPRPAMTYGAQKLVGEILIDDFSRRGWIDGRSLRIPGVLARPPARTGQLSAFLSDIIRELAAGRPFTCPMSAEATTWASSLPNVVSNLLHAAAPSLPGLESRRTFTLPTSRFSMRQLVTAIGEVRGAAVHPLVTYQPEPHIEALFGSFGELRTDAALAAGFERDASLADLVRLALQGDASGV
ncbi:NAD-dependent epimerase/dehydratase family protein [Variovorax sp. LjRoot130]|uniref:NAD-dependent epimerase/dehydratase family protein n=1 Tax=unclassified Variovorax TaxID=663243 RepID=UPI003ED07372